MRYEDLCADTVGVCARITEWLGIDSDNVRLDYRSVEHHLLGNPMRLVDTSAIKVDERWRDELGPEDLHSFDRIAGAVNRDLGYA